MFKTVSRFEMTAVLLISLALLSPSNLLAQCMLSPVVVGMPGANTITVYQYFTLASRPQGCVATASNAYGCYPALAPDTMNVSFLLASAMTATTMTMNVSCVWDCDCGTVTIDNSDGLPVELMEFAVD